jgi:hypothetical protein
MTTTIDDPDVRRGSGRTTRQLQQLVKQLKAHPGCLAVYIVHADSFIDVVQSLLVKHCGLVEPRWKNTRRGEFVDQHSGATLRIQATSLDRWYKERDTLGRDLHNAVDHYVWEVEFERAKRSIARRYHKDSEEA